MPRPPKEIQYNILDAEGHVAATVWAHSAKSDETVTPNLPQWTRLYRGKAQIATAWYGVSIYEPRTEPDATATARTEPEPPSTIEPNKK